MSYIDDDLGTFFSGLDAVAVTFNGVTRNGYFNTPEAPFETGPVGGVQSQRLSLDIPADAFSPMPKSRDTITVVSSLMGTLTCRVEDKKVSEDGRVWTLRLAL